MNLQFLVAASLMSLSLVAIFLHTIKETPDRHIWTGVNIVVLAAGALRWFPQWSRLVVAGAFDSI